MEKGYEEEDYDPLDNVDDHGIPDDKDPGWIHYIVESDLGSVRDTLERLFAQASVPSPRELGVRGSKGSQRKLTL